MLFTALSVHELIEGNSAAEFDAHLIVDKKSIPIHRHYMALISPVFAAMFKEGTKEAKTGQVDIIDFTYETVKQAVDFCYGINITDKSAFKLVDFYRFVDKYDIAPIRKKLDAYFDTEITSDCFCAFLLHASARDDEKLMKKCAKFLKSNMQLALHPDFTAMEPTVMKRVLNLAATFVDNDVSNDNSENVSIVHYAVTCDECKTKPIIGARFKCAVCRDFDLCDSCEKKGLHDEHQLLQVVCKTYSRNLNRYCT